MVKDAAPAVPYYPDAPIAGADFDALARAALARRLVEVVTGVPVDAPVAIGLIGAPGWGKTSVLYMAGEALADRGDLHAIALDAWTAGGAGKLTDAFMREVSAVFAAEDVVGRADKLRDKLVDLGGVVSSVARLAGVTVDIKGALGRSPDQLREEVSKLTTAVGKRIVVAIDHLDRLPGADAIAVVKLVERWCAFPYFAFVLALDRAQLERNLAAAEGDDGTLDRVLAMELPLPPPGRVELAAWVRGGLADLGRALGLDAGPALALFDVADGLGLELVTTLRRAKRLLNTLGAALPLAGAGADLRAACLIELIRTELPDAYPIVLGRLPLAADASARGRIAARLARMADAHPHPTAAAALVAAVLATT
jgi:KAP family P-loop domain